MRLDRFLSELNRGSRSQVKTLIRQGLLTVNGNPAVSADQKIDEHHDVIAFRGEVLRYRSYVYYMMNKPAGVITATEDAREKTVLDILKSYLDTQDLKRKIVPAGRLDKDTEGLLLLTDDGALVHDLLSPVKHVEKTYLATLEHSLSAEEKKQLEEGVDIGEKNPTAPACVEILPENQILLTIHEGKFHQVKRMLHAVNNRVTALKRVGFGALNLDDSLKPGECRELTETEIAQLHDRGKG